MSKKIIKKTKNAYYPAYKSITQNIAILICSLLVLLLGASTFVLAMMIPTPAKSFELIFYGLIAMSLSSYGTVGSIFNIYRLCMGTVPEQIYDNKVQEKANAISTLEKKINSAQSKKLVGIFRSLINASKNPLYDDFMGEPKTTYSLDKLETTNWVHEKLSKWLIVSKPNRHKLARIEKKASSMLSNATQKKLNK